MTIQEIMDKACKGLASQGFQRSMSNEGCLYRGSGGKKCAIGHLIPDDLAEKWEGTNISGICMDRRESFDTVFQGVSTVFLMQLQIAHDNGSIPEIMKSNLRKVCEDYSLTIPEELK